MRIHRPMQKVPLKGKQPRFVTQVVAVLLWLYLAAVYLIALFFSAMIYRVSTLARCKALALLVNDRLLVLVAMLTSFSFHTRLAESNSKSHSFGTM